MYINKEEDAKDILTREETARLLSISLPTLWNWTKKNILTAYGIGGRVYYKKDEVINALIPFNQL
ncbi:helix-turn-helix domain-containing protein [Empedobacter sp. R132-2]|uniref:helix-turn-helix domain-containing protein n=1 Tax=Empedobacter sp. R132-2 TaxID=2746740 RepID=UPI00257747A5|nr:helix-turn-helix domain-containing protein [Empedobacter sp. R132-2]MDM1140051.1 helix-turn-helix domain-containing protein [Empedobacter sp. R132-2]